MEKTGKTEASSRKLPPVLDTVRIVYLFADDTKLFNSHKKSKIMQQDLLTLTKWSNVWQINFNISKCSVLHIGVKN